MSGLTTSGATEILHRYFGNDVTEILLEQAQEMGQTLDLHSSTGYTVTVTWSADNLYGVSVLPIETAA